MFKKAREKKLSEEVVNQIMYLISNKKIKYGDLLPSEEELARQIGVSRATVREGLRMLEFLGVVETKRGKGTIVIKTDKEGIKRELSSAISNQGENILELMQVRQILEPEIAKLAALEASEYDIENMERALLSMELDINYGGAAVQESIDFHYTMIKSIHNSVLTYIMTTVLNLQKESRNLTLRLPGRPGEALAEHRKVLEAIKDRQPDEAKKYMREHLNSTAKLIKGSTHKTSSSSKTRS